MVAGDELIQNETDEWGRVLRKAYTKSTRNKKNNEKREREIER